MGKRTDLLAGIVLALFSVFYYYNAMHVRIFRGMGKAIVSSQTLPKIWGVCMYILALCLIIRGLRAKKKSGERMSFGEWVKENTEVLATFAALIIYVLVMEYIGFIISSLVYIFVQTIILTPRAKRNYVVAGVIAVVFSFGTYYVFVNFLSVLLPAGRIFS